MIQVASTGTPLYRRRRGISVTSSAGAAFNPLTLSPIVWWDLSLQGQGDGTAISSITDRSGNAHTLSQATGANQPLAKTGANGINSLAVALFDGVDDFLATASFATNQTFVVYAVVTGGGVGGANRYLGTGDATASCRVGYDTTPGSGAPDNFAGASLIGSASTAFGTPKVMTSVFNGVSSLIRVDGTQVASGDAGAGNLTGGITLGASASTAGQPWNGKIGEALIHAGTTVSTAYEASLKTKWGTA